MVSCKIGKPEENQSSKPLICIIKYYMPDNDIVIVSLLPRHIQFFLFIVDGFNTRNVFKQFWVRAGVQPYAMWLN